VAVSVCRQQIELARAAIGAIAADVFPTLQGPSDDGHIALPRLSTGQRPRAFLMIKLDAEIADLSSRAATRHLPRKGPIDVDSCRRFTRSETPGQCGSSKCTLEGTPCPAGIRLDLDQDRAKRNVRYRNVSQRNRTDGFRPQCHRSVRRPRIRRSARLLRRRKRTVLQLTELPSCRTTI
jgi:hypothetical protein